MTLHRHNFALDREWRTPKQRRELRELFAYASKAEKQFQVKLLKVAHNIDEAIKTMAHGTLASAYAVTDWMRRYAELLEPWAIAVVRRMHTEIETRDRKAWEEYSNRMGRELRLEVEKAPVGHLFQAMLDAQVTLIKSLPIEAAERVHRLTIEHLLTGERTRDLIDDIMQTGNVTRARARLIARTETARTASVLTQARAEHAGSTHYQWVSARDENVRPTHAKLDRESRNGKLFAWADPPECDPGHHAHPGQIFNCRCVAFPHIPLN